MKTKIQNLIEEVMSTNAVQTRLERLSDKIHRLMGIGGGADVAKSGESVLIKRLHSEYCANRNKLCIFDVGANKGQFTKMLVSGLRDDRYTIHAFEPSIAAYDVLVEETKHFDNVIINNLGLGAVSEERLLYYDVPGSEIASLTKRRLEHYSIIFSEYERIKIVTLDEYCNNSSIDKINLLKIDVEGHELDVMRGSIRMMKESAVDMITFEFGGCNIDTRTYFQDYWYFLNEYGMGNLYKILRGGYLSPIKKYRESNEQFKTTNYLAIRENITV